MFRTEVDPDSPKGRPPCPTRIRRLTRMVGSTYTVLTLLLLSKSNLLKLTLLHIPRLWYMSRCCATYPASAYFSSPSRDWGHNHPEFSQAPSWDILRTSARLRWCRISRVCLSTCKCIRTPSQDSLGPGFFIFASQDLIFGTEQLNSSRKNVSGEKSYKHYFLYFWTKNCVFPWFSFSFLVNPYMIRRPEKL